MRYIFDWELKEHPSRLIFFKMGTFAVLHQDNKIYVLPPVNNVDTCDQFVWSGSDIENIYPTVAMNGLTANSHYDRGRFTMHTDGGRLRCGRIIMVNGIAICIRKMLCR